MSGTALVMTSPSSSIRRRRTPCVAGCDGPIFKTRRSASVEWAAASCILNSVVLISIPDSIFNSDGLSPPVGFPLRPRLALFGDLPAGSGHERPAIHRRGVGILSVPARQRKILAQGKGRAPLPHQGPAQI